jgi:4-alpha-glucanotransferase
MFASHADTLIIPVQDMLLYGSDTRINKPGIAEGNWSYRVTKEQFWRIDREKFKYFNYLYGRRR